MYSEIYGSGFVDVEFMGLVFVGLVCEGLRFLRLEFDN